MLRCPCIILESTRQSACGPQSVTLVGTLLASWIVKLLNSVQDCYAALVNIDRIARNCNTCFDKMHANLLAIISGQQPKAGTSLSPAMLFHDH
jgi:hypothetical protein